MENSKLLFLKKSFEQPDERREFKAHGHLDMVSFDDGNSFGRAIFEPGWKWSNDVKPIAGTELCEAPHIAYCVKGCMVVRMKDGKELRMKAGDVATIPPGHDAWVEGDEPAELLEFSGYKDYAKPKSSDQEKAA